MTINAKLLVGVGLAASLLLATAARATEYQVPGASTNESPDLIAFNGTLYLFYRDPSTNDIQYHTSTDGTTWSASSQVPSTQGVYKGPSTALFASKLYVVFRLDQGVVNERVFYVSLDAFGTWSGVAEVRPADVSGGGTHSLQVKGDPAAAEFDGKLFVVFTDDVVVDDVQYTTTSDGTSWTTEVTVQSADSTSGPGAVAFNGSLFIFWRRYTDASRYVYVEASGAIHGPFSPGGSTSHEPHATVHGSLQYLAYKGQSTNNVYHRNQDVFGTWSSETNSGGDSSRGPGGTSYSQLWLCYKGQSTNSVYVNNQ